MDWIGIVVSILALFALFFMDFQKKKAIEEQKEKAAAEDNPLHEYLKEVETRERIQQNRNIPPTPSVPTQLKKKREQLEQRHLVSPLKDERIKSATENRHLTSKLQSRTIQSAIIHTETEGRKEGKSKAQTIVEELPHLRNMLIYYEIFGPPKGLQ